MQLADETADQRIVAQALLYKGQGLATLRTLIGGLRYLERAVETARAGGARDVEGLALREYGLRLVWLGDHAKGRTVLQEALDVCRDIGDLAGEANVLDALALTSLQSGRYIEAVELVEQGLALQREVGNRYDEGYGLHTLGWALCLLGRYDEAMVAADASAELLMEVEASYGVAYALTIRAKVLTDLGCYEEARSVFEEVRSLADPEEDVYPRLQVWDGLALVHYLLGEDDVALAHGTQLVQDLDRAAETRAWYPVLRVWSWLIMGHIWLERGEFGPARDYYERALAVVDDPVILIAMRPKIVLDLRAGLARLAHAQGDTARAIDHVEAIVDELLAGDIAGALEPMRVYLICYRVLDAVGDPRASEVVAEGHRILQERAANIEDEELRHSYLHNVAANREIAAVWEGLRESGA
jgi:tetratricopeptide (TPR) repeat protein